MSLGEKLRQARLEAGLSQRALSGETITRNMLSQIENGSAQPSMATLQYLAGQLQKPVSYFLEEAVPSQPLPALWQTVEALEQARQLICLGRITDARTILFRLEVDIQNTPDWIFRQWLLLLSHMEPEQACRHFAQLPALEPELELRARAALQAGDGHLCCKLLGACQHPSVAWQLLMGEGLLLQKLWQEAAVHFSAVEKEYPHRACAALEICYREMEDYQKAYFYACRIRSLSK